MTAPQTVQSHPASVDAYIRHGWSLVPIPANTKGPRTPGWNLRENALKSQADLPQGYGIGLAHAYSGTMALDIDNWTVTTSLLAQHGIDLQALYNAPDAVVINSGKPGHGKLLYTMPFGAALPSKKIMHGGITAYELRCATVSGVTVQDVLPPSIHPETHQPYQWAGRGHWTRIPTIPQPLLDLWNGMLNQDKERTIDTGGVVDASWEEIRQALDAVPADCTRDEWINIGMALHWAGTQTNQLDQALHLWNEWSATGATKYPGEREVLTQWISFKPDKMSAVKLGTLFHIAKQHGWQRPTPDVADLFSKIEVPVREPLNVIDGLRPKPPEMMLDLWP
ncbi:MAG TPA: bifunctional DNA primase/polymerase, partial [Burkholderiaceae bacterium]|nr:bifunctional DNA primase/polymerase [Burkholderiaceae bacterium]